MPARIISMAEWQAAHPRRVVRLRVVFDPFWALRLWLSCWGIK